MKVSHVHFRVRDSPAADRWFEQVLQVVPVVHNERIEQHSVQISIPNR
jgi:hypothetical protein